MMKGRCEMVLQEEKLTSTTQNFIFAETASVLVIIPAYNEANNIVQVVRSVKQHTANADVLVINDGSKDQTALLAASAGAFVVSHPLTWVTVLPAKPGLSTPAARDTIMSFRWMAMGSTNPPVFPIC